ncbi:MAG: helix-turn-helix transcriptional regulator [Clostridia bacterium]|nr:helix-turn-helix transcriptional regulator [Clostridia bacterium]
MFKNKAENGLNNICGKKIYELRKSMSPKMSQRMLAELLQLNGVDVDKNAVQRMESGQRFITDIEILTICKIFKISANELFGCDF